MLQQTHIFSLTSLVCRVLGLNGVFKRLVEPSTGHSSPRMCSHGVRTSDRSDQRAEANNSHTETDCNTMEGEIDALAGTRRHRLTGASSAHSLTNACRSSLRLVPACA
jgi:hypothetical protein